MRSCPQIFCDSYTPPSRRVRCKAGAAGCVHGMRVVLVAAFLASTVVARPIRIAATGDSYTWGRKCNGDPYTNSYPVRMQQILKEEYGYETNVSNAGLFNVAFEYALNPAIKQYAVRYCEEGQGYCGKSGDLHYPDMIKEVSADADVMLIMMGTNDVELKTEETFDWTRWHDIYSQWLDYVRTFFSGPIMLIVPPVHCRVRSYHWISSIPRLSAFSGGAV